MKKVFLVLLIFFIFTNDAIAASSCVMSRGRRQVCLGDQGITLPKQFSQQIVIWISGQHVADLYYRREDQLLRRIRYEDRSIKFLCQPAIVEGETLKIDWLKRKVYQLKNNVIRATVDGDRLDILEQSGMIEIESYGRSGNKEILILNF